MVGKGIYEGILVELPFAGFFLNKVLGRNNYRKLFFSSFLSLLFFIVSYDRPFLAVDDLITLDSELYKNLLFIKHYKGDVEDLCLYFFVTEEVLGVQKITELMPGGKNILVTNKNKMTYIYLMAFYKLNLQINPACNAFLQGLSDLIDLSWLKLFDQVMKHLVCSFFLLSFF